MTKIEQSAGSETQVWSISGMDCASCAAKVHGAVERLPGVSQVQVSVMSERMTLSLKLEKTSKEKIASTIKSLGYGADLRPAKATASATATLASAEADDLQHEAGCGHDHEGHDSIKHDHAKHEHGKHDHSGHDHAKGEAAPAMAAKNRDSG